MIDLEQYLYDKVKPIFDTWTDPDIYAVSFFLYSNEMHEYRGVSNLTFFNVSYNTEEQCDGAGPHSEERWNYAFWLQNEVPVMDSHSAREGMDVLFDWYAQEGIGNIGYEDAEMEAPVGFGELARVLARVARRFQEEGYFLNRLGKRIPIIIHDLEFCPCVMDATAYANPNGEADDFFVEWENASPDYSGPAFHVTQDMEQVMDLITARMQDGTFMEQMKSVLSQNPTKEALDELTKQFWKGLK